MGGIFTKEEPVKNQIFSHKTVNVIIKLAST